MKLKLNKGLKINKEVIGKLEDEQMKIIQGGKSPESTTCAQASCQRCIIESTDNVISPK